MRKVLTSALAALVAGTALAVTPVPGGAGEARDHAPGVVTAWVQPVRHGPYATLDRANQVANYFRRLGYNAEVIYGGTLDYREYYVDVW